MIFVTVGSDLPFDRLVRTVDEWAQKNRRTDVFAQIGETMWKPAYIPYKAFLEPTEFSGRIAEAKTIISHAGMGTILSALMAQKPIVVMPRLHRLREVRNEHQLATIRRLGEMGMVDAVLDEGELLRVLDHLDEIRPKEKIRPFASPELLDTLRVFIRNA